VIEVRALGVYALDSKTGQIVPAWNESRQYRAEDVGRIADCIRVYSGQSRGVYSTLNPLAVPAERDDGLPVDCWAWAAKDQDVLRRRWLLVDLDRRKTGADKDQSATDEERAAVLSVGLRIRDDMLAAGWPAPVVNDSGNGVHLLWRIDLPVQDNGLVRRVLLALRAKYNTGQVEIDELVHNPSRICRLPFTMACKGEDTLERPHRMARVLEMPLKLESVPTSLLEQLAATVPIVNSSCSRAVFSTPATATRRFCPLLPKRYHNLVVNLWARNYLKRAKVSVEGQKGNDQAVYVICYLENDLALPKEVAWPLLLEWNARCQPPWSEAELERKWTNSVLKSKGKRGSKLPDSIREQVRQIWFKEYAIWQQQAG
jgi:hypothetical protein